MLMMFAAERLRLRMLGQGDADDMMLSTLKEGWGETQDARTRAG